MLDYPHFDGTQACQDPSAAASSAFSGTIGADPTPALALCGTCRYVDECRDWALSHDVYGVWGGTTEADRVEIRGQDELPTPDSITDQLDELVIAMRSRVVIDDPILMRASRPSDSPPPPEGMVFQHAG